MRPWISSRVPAVVLAKTISSSDSNSLIPTSRTRTAAATPIHSQTILIRLPSPTTASSLLTATPRPGRKKMVRKEGVQMGRPAPMAKSMANSPRTDSRVEAVMPRPMPNPETDSQMNSRKLALPATLLSRMRPTPTRDLIPAAMQADPKRVRMVSLPPRLRTWGREAMPKAALPAMRVWRETSMSLSRPQTGSSRSWTLWKRPSRP